MVLKFKNSILQRAETSSLCGNVAGEDKAEWEEIMVFDYFVNWVKWWGVSSLTSVVSWVFSSYSSYDFDISQILLYPCLILKSLLGIISMLFNILFPQPPSRPWDRSKMCEIISVLDKCLYCKSGWESNISIIWTQRYFWNLGERQVVEKKRRIQVIDFLSMSRSCQTLQSISCSLPFLHDWSILWVIMVYIFI